MTRLLYGTLPPRKDFDAAFDRKYKRQTVSVEDPIGHEITSVEFCADTLWEIVSLAVLYPPPPRGSGAMNAIELVLNKLGFEWAK